MNTTIRLPGVFRFLVIYAYIVCLGLQANEGSRTAEISELKSILEAISIELDLLRSKPQSSERHKPQPSMEIDQNQDDLRPEIRETEVNSNNILDPQNNFVQIPTDRKGYYIRPYLGVLFPSDIDWKSFMGNQKIEGSGGLSLGLGAGYDFSPFFIDLQLSYFQQDLKSIDLPLNFSGKVDGLGIHLTGGGHVQINEYLTGIGGLGLGRVNQDVSFSLNGLSVREQDLLFSAQFFLGLEFRPRENMIIGLRYRRMIIEDTQSFSDRNMHYLEMSSGYLF
jgi:opacity protein-like surface antigen